MNSPAANKFTTARPSESSACKSPSTATPAGLGIANATDWMAKKGAVSIARGRLSRAERGVVRHCHSLVVVVDRVGQPVARHVHLQREVGKRVGLHGARVGIDQLFQRGLFGRG